MSFWNLIIFYLKISSIIITVEVAEIWCLRILSFTWSLESKKLRNINIEDCSAFVTIMKFCYRLWLLFLLKIAYCFIWEMIMFVFGLCSFPYLCLVIAGFWYRNLWFIQVIPTVYNCDISTKFLCVIIISTC